VHVPFGDYMYRVYSSEKHWRSERFIYRLIGANPKSEQTWATYARSVLAFSAVSIVFLFTLQLVQKWLPLHLHDPATPMTPALAWNTAVSFVTNTNWQDYSGESTLGHSTQMAGLAVQNFVSAAVGMAVAIALVRGFARRHTGELGTNGGGFYNANSSHPFENPTVWTNWLEIFLILVISFSLPRTFGRMVGNKKQGYAIAAVMGVIAAVSISLMMLFQLQHHGTVPTAVGAAMEGVEQRFGVANSAVFADSTTLTSCGAIDSWHDSYTSLGGMMAMFNMQLGEVAPGGVGSGLYGMLILAVIAVFVAGLMVGRTPEYLGKKITAREIKLAASYFLVTPILVLIGTAVAMALPGERASMANGGPHGLSEVLYAFTSAANNNGSAFAGLNANTVWYNTALGLAMLIGRFLPMILVLALASSLARQGPTPASLGTLPTYRPQFVGLVVGVTVILVALTFLPALALGPLAEGIH
ncbi:MAG TPA: potassium-transporting ATPase subunit KdpA, partial [Mycobacterium sp.]|nr:potassium-transporting ATPase subunit KdpA [Mycobacterium sp.]